MTPDEMRFREYLACYGSDIDSWPPEVRAHGQHMRHYPECAALLEAENYFEHLLRERRFEPAYSGMATRICNAAAGRRQVKGGWIYDRTARLSSAAVAATLILGFAIGFGALPSLHAPQQVSQQVYTDDDGAML